MKWFCQGRLKNSHYLIVVLFIAIFSAFWHGAITEQPLHAIRREARSVIEDGHVASRGTRRAGARAF